MWFNVQRHKENKKFNISQESHCFHPLCSVARISLDESNLIITDVNKGDEGNYTCVIKSELEEKSASAHLMVMGMLGIKYYDII